MLVVLHDFWLFVLIFSSVFFFFLNNEDVGYFMAKCIKPHWLMLSIVMILKFSLLYDINLLKIKSFSFN
jgi:hypothetical protein